MSTVGVAFLVPFVLISALYPPADGSREFGYCAMPAIACPADWPEALQDCPVSVSTAIFAPKTRATDASSREGLNNSLSVTMRAGPSCISHCGGAEPPEL